MESRRPIQNDPLQTTGVALVKALACKRCLKMPGRKLSREELFALVWEKPTSEIAKELGLSDVAIGKLCTKLQVPKPPRGNWALMHPEFDFHRR